MQRRAVALVLFACALSCGLVWPAHAQDLTFTPYKPGGIYALSETVGWHIAAAPGARGEYTYEIRRDNLVVLKSGRIDPTSPVPIEVTVAQPAMIYVEVKSANADAKPIALGAAVAPDRLRPSVKEPRDFDRFWARKIDALQKIAPNPQLTQKPSDQEGVDYFTLQMDHIDGKHVYGQVAKPARPGKFPGLVIFQWASPPYPLQKQWVTDRAAEGWLAVNIEPHDVLPDQPQSYYDALPKELKEYHTIGREDRDRNYFLQMYLADYRAVEYLASRPDWDGKTLIVMGTSMGGQQSLCAAGLNSKVTGLIVHVPAGADAHGPLHGRASGYPNWPTDNPKAMTTAGYFDTVNCAARVKVPSLVSMGFIDTVTPPVGIWIAYNQIRGPKEAVPMRDAAHNHQATEAQQAPYTVRSSEWLRDYVRGGEPLERADRPSPRLDANSRRAHELLLEKRRQGKIDVYFMGDSITRRWGAADPQYAQLLANWQQNFFGWNVGNFGWGGDKTQNILWRLQEGELEGVNPKVIVLMAGTNNIGRLTPVGDDRARIDDITRGMAAIIKRARKQAPRATIILTGILPRNDNIAVMPTIERINANLARMANGKSIRYISINDKLADANGKLFDGMTDPDQLHLSVKAYQIWADALKPLFTEILGPPAATDQAPPPTGDPSAMK